MTSGQFCSLGLRDELQTNLAEIGYHQMTPVQKASLGPILEGKDVTVQAKTGSGKTAAFGLGLLSRINTEVPNIQVMVLCPTRELSEQVAREIRKLAQKIPNTKILTLCGGTPIAPQVASLEHGAHCVVGTPGRIGDHLSRQTLNMKNIKLLVLDEADRMLDMGFSEALSQITRKMPRERQTLLFSATFPKDIEALSKNLQKTPVNVKIAAANDDADIDQLFYQVPADQQIRALLLTLSQHDPESAVVFCNTKVRTQEVADELGRRGFSVRALHGDLDQWQRDEVLTLFAQKSCSVLVATDVAARGLDIHNLQVVVNLELCKDPETYVHRIGRTGRAGHKGLAVSFVTPKERLKLGLIEQQLGREIEVRPISESRPPKGFKMIPGMISLRIGSGKKNKIRPTDILGALTKDPAILGEDVGKISIFDFHSLVAVKAHLADTALKLLNSKPVKGKVVKARRVPFHS